MLQLFSKFSQVKKYFIEDEDSELKRTLLMNTKNIPLVCDRILLIYDLYIIVALSLVTGSISLIKESLFLWDSDYP